MAEQKTIHVFRSISTLTGRFYGRSGPDKTVRLENITIQEFEGRKGVYLLSDFRRESLIGFVDEESEQLLEGIKMDDRVCVEGNYFETRGHYFKIKKIEKYD